MSLYGFAHLQRKTLTVKLLEKPTLRENFGFRETDVKMGDETYLYDIYSYSKKDVKMLLKVIKRYYITNFYFQLMLMRCSVSLTIGRYWRHNGLIRLEGPPRQNEIKVPDPVVKDLISHEL